ncbi:MAG: hypothetical protein KOO62_09185 [candidate division Zixibacteria bacterium]|nr:hypothetical protein [candidate division Zixibacteria bacterium]
MTDNFLSALPEAERTAIETHRTTLSPEALAEYDMQLAATIADNEASFARADVADRGSKELDRQRLLEKQNSIPEYQRRRTALHEASHLIVANALKIGHAGATIIPDGSSWGRVMANPSDYASDLREESCLAHLQIYLASVSNAKSTDGADSGCADDILTATTLANAMVSKYGMSEKLGCVAYDTVTLITRPDIQEKVDKEVRFFCERAERQAGEILEQNQDQLVRLADALFERNELSKEEIDKIILGVEENGSQEM